MMIRRDVWREYSRGSLWLLPVVAVVVSVGLGAVLSRINVSPDSLLAFQGTADDARNLLIGISSTMVTVIALLLGLAVVALQLSSTQFSPRLLRNFLRDRPNQVVLSVFVGTFGYSAAGLFEVGVSGGERVTEFPRFAVTVAVGLLFLSLGLLVFFADHLAHSIQVDQVMRVAENATLDVIRKLPTGGERMETPPPGAHVGGGAIVRIRAGHLRRRAAEDRRGAPRPHPAATQGRRARRRGHRAGLGMAYRRSIARAAGPRRRRDRGRADRLRAHPRTGSRAGDAAVVRRGVQGAFPCDQRSLHRDPGHRTPLRAVQSPRDPAARRSSSSTRSTAWS